MLSSDVRFYRSVLLDKEKVFFIAGYFRHVTDVIFSKSPKWKKPCSLAHGVTRIVKRTWWNSTINFSLLFLIIVRAVLNSLSMQESPSERLGYTVAMFHCLSPPSFSHFLNKTKNVVVLCCGHSSDVFVSKQLTQSLKIPLGDCWLRNRTRRAESPLPDLAQLCTTTAAQQHRSTSTDGRINICGS